GLRDALVGRGHEVAVITLPYKWYPRRQIVSSALAWRLVDITVAGWRRVDVAICSKWSYFSVRHPFKVTWLLHQFRQVHDLCCTCFALTHVLYCCYSTRL